MIKIKTIYNLIYFYNNDNNNDNGDKIQKKVIIINHKAFSK